MILTFHVDLKKRLPVACAEVKQTLCRPPVLLLRSLLHDAPYFFEEKAVFLRRAYRDSKAVFEGWLMGVAPYSYPRA